MAVVLVSQKQSRLGRAWIAGPHIRGPHFRYEGRSGSDAGALAVGVRAPGGAVPWSGNPGGGLVYCGREPRDAGPQGLSPLKVSGTLYLLGVVVVSTAWGLVLAMATSVVSAIVLDYSRHWPDKTFRVQLRNGVVIIGFLVVALLTNFVVGLARARAVEADQRRREASALAEQHASLRRVATGCTQGSPPGESDSSSSAAFRAPANCVSTSSVVDLIRRVVICLLWRDARNVHRAADTARRRVGAPSASSKLVQWGAEQPGELLWQRYGAARVRIDGDNGDDSVGDDGASLPRSAVPGRSCYGHAAAGRRRCSRSPWWQGWR